jgi:hypothetical protein
MRLEPTANCRRVPRHPVGPVAMFSPVLVRTILNRTHTDIENVEARC